MPHRSGILKQNANSTVFESESEQNPKTRRHLETEGSKLNDIFI